MGKSGEVKTGESKTGDTTDGSVTASVSMGGSGDLSVSAKQTRKASVTFAGSGDLTVDPAISITASVSMGGSGDLTATPLVQSFNNVEWRVKRDGTEETDLFDARVIDTANPFGDFSIAKIDDVSGTKFSQYTRGTKVEFDVRPAGSSSFSTRFIGFVVEARELDQQSDQLEVECYSFDQFLRRGTVSNDQTGNTISEALQDIIETDTPVTWNASKVTVADDIELTQSYRGERIENALNSLRDRSDKEDFGVDDDLEFFFRPREADTAPRDIDDSQWLNYDLPQDGKRTINEVTVFFNEGNESVTVDDGGDKEDLQDSIGTDDPIAFADEVSRPSITTTEDAQAVAEQLLEGKKTTLTGTVTTFGLFDAEPGDVISIEITNRGIDSDFRIAEIDYRWGRDQTILTVVEKRGDQDDLLVNLSDTVKRVELQDVDRDAISNRVASTNLVAEIDTTGDVDGESFETAKITNTARDKLRDGWAGNGNLDITQIAVGNGTGTPNREDSTLGNELDRENATENLPDTTTAEYSATISESDVREVGLFDSDGDLIARATIPDASLTSPVDVTISLAVSDASDRGVVTDSGQEAIRDVIADSAPDVPTIYGWGDDGTDPTESDSTLGNGLVFEGLDSRVLQSALSTSSFEEIASFADDVPVTIQNNQIELLQSTWLSEAEDGTFDGTELSETGWSNDAAIRLEVVGDFVQFEFSTDYRVPDGEIFLATYSALDNFDGTVEVSFDGETVNADTFGGTTASNDFRFPSLPNVGDLNPGETHRVRVEVTELNSGSVDVDVIYVIDEGDRHGGFNISASGTFDAASATWDAPELYADQWQFQFETADTNRTVTEADADQEWNNTENNQQISLSNDGGDTWETTTNSETASATFDSAETDVDTRMTLSRYTDNTESTPNTGDAGQAISEHVLRANPQAVVPNGTGTVNVRSIVTENTLSGGTTIREAGQLIAGNIALTRSTFAEFDVEANQRVISSEDIEFRNP